MKPYLQLSRPPNGLMMFFAVLVGIIFSEYRLFTFQALLSAFITSFGLTSASMALNDFFDKEVDLINNPSRPIPSGKISPQSALFFAASMAFLGLVSAYIASAACFAMASLAFAVSTAYNWFLKKTGFVGNLAVSFTVVAPFLYGSILSDGAVSPRVLVFAALAFLANTGREVIKGMTDVEGDAVRQVATVARKHGIKAAAVVGAGFYLTAVALSPLPYVMNVVGPPYLWVVALADSGFIYSSVKILRKPSPEEARKQKNLTLAWMFVALVSFAVGGLV